MIGYGFIGFAGLAAMPQILLGTTAVIAVLCVELPRSLGIVDLKPYDVFLGCRRFLSFCAPEALGLVGVFLVAVLMRLRGDMEVRTYPEAVEIWEEIKAEWPVLMGADTLLNFQSMLRLLIFASVAFRAGLFHGIKPPTNKMVTMSLKHQNGSATATISPLSGAGAALLLAGMLARARLYSRSEIYKPEGPLSGDVPLFCDLCSLPLLLSLSLSAIRPRSGSPLSITGAVAFAMWIASCHHLNLARNSSIDSLFTLCHILEFIAALVFLCRAAVDSGCDAEGGQRGRALVGFVHVLMAFQQALSAYYFLTAFEPSPYLTGAGHPCCVLSWCNLLAFGAYLCAAGLYLGGLCADSSDHNSSIQL